MPLNRTLVGKSYEPKEYVVRPEATVAYAKAYNEDNPWLTDPRRPGGVVAPPLFGVVYIWEAVASVMGDGETLGITPEMLLRLVHGAQDLFFDAPVRPGDTITSRAHIQGVDERSTGEVLVIGVTSENQKKERVQRAFMTIFFRGGKKREGAKAPPPPEVVHTPLFSKAQTIDRDQTYRYAEASGDQNPIHVNEEIAKMAGLPGIIVHGLCTMAFTSKVMIDGLAGGNPLRLKRLAVRFSKPVLPGQTITTRVWKESEEADRGIFGFETFNPAGEAVIKNGAAEVARG